MLGCQQVASLKDLGLIMARGIHKRFDHLDDLLGIRIKHYFSLVDEFCEQICVTELERKVVFKRCDLVEVTEFRDTLSDLFVS